MKDAFRSSNDDTPWFSLALGIPALLGWIGYGLAVLLAPHLAADPNPLIWAAVGPAIWYFLWAVFAAGPWAFLLLSGWN